VIRAVEHPKASRRQTANEKKGINRSFRTFMIDPPVTLFLHLNRCMKDCSTKAEFIRELVEGYFEASLNINQAIFLPIGNPASEKANTFCRVYP
jgi:hypothetical protein